MSALAENGAVNTGMGRRSLVIALVYLAAIPILVVGQDSSPSQLDSWDTPGRMAPLANHGAHDIVADELIVGLKGSWNPQRAAEVAVYVQGTVAGAIPRLSAARLRIPGGAAGVESARQMLMANPSVRYAEYNAVGQLAQEEPNDTYFPTQWNLKNVGQDVGQGGGSPGADIEIIPAWEITTGDESVIVAVLDTGSSNMQHPEVQGRLVPGYDYVDEDQYPYGGWHGAAVIGVLAANADNAWGIAGVDLRCKVMPIKVGTEVTPPGEVLLFDLAQGIDHATAAGVDVINMSLKGLPVSQLLDDALEAAVHAGITCIAAAGNSGGFEADEFYPAASPHVITIGATNKFDERAYFSCVGTALDFVAPGAQVPTVSVDANDYPAKMGGTSASAPIASGIIALLKSVNKSLSPEAVYELLRAGAEDGVGDPTEDLPGWDPFYGHGRLNAYRSLKALCSCEGGETLVVSPPALSLTEGGTWVFRVDGGAANANEPYLLLGSLAGTQPGVTLAQTSWPLALDPYMHLLISHPGASPLHGSWGLLNDAGQSTAELTIPAGLSTAWAGLNLYHAVAVYDDATPRPYGSVPLLQGGPVTAEVGGAPGIVFQENFESGGLGWSFGAVDGGLWHLASAGECAASSAAATFNGGAPACSYQTPGGVSGTLRSPSFVLTGKPPFRLAFTSTRDLEPVSAGATSVHVVDETGTLPVKTQTFGAGAFTDDASGSAATYLWKIPNSSKLAGRSVHLEFSFSATEGGGTGWTIDDVVLSNDG